MPPKKIGIKALGRCQASCSTGLQRPPALCKNDQILFTLSLLLFIDSITHHPVIHA